VCVAPQITCYCFLFLAGMNITKLDVLTGHSEIKVQLPHFPLIHPFFTLDTPQVCVGYEYNGKRLESFPASLEVLKDVKPVYQTFKGWSEDISKA
jgi:adenylosuccinate synthase